MTFDMTETIKPKSDQLNADDLIAGDMVIRVTNVTRSNSADQPVNIHYEGDDGKPYKPCKGMRRILVSAWGRDASQYIGKYLELFREPSVTFGNLSVGGIRISKLSNITNPLGNMTQSGNKFTMVITASRGKKTLYEIQELTINDNQAWMEASKTINKADNLEALKLSWQKNFSAWKSSFTAYEFSELESIKNLKKIELEAPEETAEPQKLSAEEKAKAYQELTTLVNDAGSLEELEALDTSVAALFTQKMQLDLNKLIATKKNTFK